MSTDAYATIFVGVPLKDLVKFAGVVQDPVTKYNEDTGQPYQATKPRNLYRLLNDREVEVETLNGDDLIHVMGIADALKACDGGEVEWLETYYGKWEDDAADGFVGVRVAGASSYSRVDIGELTEVDPLDIQTAIENVGTLLAEHFGLMDTEIKVYLKASLS